MTSRPNLASGRWPALWLCAACFCVWAAGCKGASPGCSRRDAADDADADTPAGQAGGSATAGVSAGTNAKALDLERFGRRHEVLFVGGFMSQFYEQMGLNLENEINAALRDSARALNVHIDLPLERQIDIPIGDAIAEALPRVVLPLEKGGFVTFYSQMQLFEAEGVAYRNMWADSESFDSGKSIEHNAVAIREVLRRMKKRVVIVTHSKGGLDTLEALIGAPELWGRPVVGWVALQAPFHGSPIADSTSTALNTTLLESLGGEGQSAEDLKTETRAAYMRENVARIARLAERVPIVAAYSTYEGSGSVTGFASAYASGIFNAGLVSEITRIVVENFEQTPRDIPRVVAASTSAAVELVRDEVAGALGDAVATIGIVDLANAYMDGILGLPNDGLVPRDSTRLPGAAHRALPTGDHASPVMDVHPFKNYWSAPERNALTVELIGEALGREARPRN